MNHPQITSVTPRSPGDESYIEFGARRLAGLCDALGFEARRAAESNELFALMLSPWGTRPMGQAPRFASDIGDDHTPFEFSVAFGGGEPELRILFEPQGAGPTVADQQRAGLELARQLGGDFGVHLDRFRVIEDLFCPEDPQGSFSVWFAVCLWPTRAPSFKIYLNPQAQGRALAPALVEEAMTRLGFAEAWAPLSRIAGARGPDYDELKYFSLDLSASEEARWKLYFRHHHIDAAALDRAFSLAHSHRDGDVREFCAALTGSPGPFAAKPVGSCFAYNGADKLRPRHATLHLPISHYVESDAVARERVAAYFAAHHLPARRYTDTLAGFAVRDPAGGVGMHSYASLRREAGAPRVTIYLSPEGYQVHPVRPEPLTATRPPRPDAAQLVEYYEQHSIADHPLFRRMAREPVDMNHLYVLLANAQRGIVEPFSRRLAQVTAKVDDESIRSILAKQLNDELGAGDPQKAHARLFAQLLAGLVHWRPPGGMTEAQLAAGTELHAGLEAIYADPDAYIGVGAAIVIEIYGKQVDLRTGQQLRRQKQVDADSLSWLTLHEELELEHASESLDLARLVPPGGAKNDSVWHGAERIAQVSWRFFDAVYSLCYGPHLPAQGPR